MADKLNFKDSVKIFIQKPNSPEPVEVVNTDNKNTNNENKKEDDDE
jgi:hypothetical protein